MKRILPIDKDLSFTRENCRQSSYSVLGPPSSGEFLGSPRAAENDGLATLRSVCIAGRFPKPSILLSITGWLE